MSIEFIALTVFVAVCMLTVGVVALVTDRKSTGQRRLMAVTTSATPADGMRVQVEQDSNTTLRLAKSLVEKVGFWSQAKFDTDRKEDKIDTLQLLSFAGMRSPRSLALYNGTRVICAVALLAVGGAVVYFVDSEKVNPITTPILGALTGFFLPKMYVNFKVARRQLTIIKSLPDVLDMLIICVEAGLGLNAALDRVANERTRIGNDVMGTELKYMTYELQAGVPREQAFHNLGSRNGVDDLKSLAAFMVQSEKLGGSLVEALKIYALELRERRRQRAQEQANKAAVKLLFPLVFFIFPTMFIVILAPAVMQLSSSMKTLH